ncbi:MAG: hypothetical protein HY298_11865 [Verrucomicrobia bacterium]|nr:hypothetical protein [Verrucomicrobiota bacterium]
MKIKYPSILTACLAVAGGATAQSLTDDFNGASINPALWSTFVTSFGNSSISESSGNVRFVNGSWLTTVAQFPNASVSGRFRISGWEYDRFKVLVRSDGTRVDTNSQVRIGGIGIQFTSGSNPDYGASQTLQLWNFQTGTFLAAAAPTIDMNTYYDFLITDSGSMISVFLSNSPIAILSFSSTTTYGNYIEFGNREQAAGSGPPPYYLDLGGAILFL